MKTGYVGLFMIVMGVGYILIEHFSVLNDKVADVDRAQDWSSDRYGELSGRIKTLEENIPPTDLVGKQTD